jgi:hypothetical protein
MREIVRSIQGNNTQFATIEWDEKDLYNYEIIMLQSDDNDDLQPFNETIEALYKKWLVGDEISLTVKTHKYQWNLNENFVPNILNQIEKNEYLARKAQRLVQNHFSKINTEAFIAEINTINNNIDKETINEQFTAINEAAKTLDEKIKNAVALTKNISLEQKWAEEGIDTNSYLDLKFKVNAIFEKLKNIRLNAFHINYNIIAPKVEAAYAQSKIDENFSETRKDLIALQKEVLAIALERWQKNELLDRLRNAFDHINTKQDAWRLLEDTKRNEQAETLQKQYDYIVPQAVNSTFSEGFTMLKDLQDLTNKSSLPRERRELFYTTLDTAFNTIKQKADDENNANFDLANKQVELAISSSSNENLFKDARQILITAQNELKEIRIGRKQKDELFGKLRVAFDALNAEQDAYFNQKKKENRFHLEDALLNIKRICSRKKEGIETLYQAKANIEAKASIIKPDKKSDGSVANQFQERLVEITAKVEAAEKDIAQLEKKIEKMEKELADIKQEN